MSNEPNQPQQPPPAQPYGPYGPQPQMPYGPPYGPPPAYPPPQPKQSKRWLWITLSVIGGIVLLSCIGCTIAFSKFGTQIFQQIRPAVVAGEYYASIQQQDYAKAYTYLATDEATIKGQPITSQDAFISLAKSADEAQGKVTAISSSDFQPPSGTTTARVTLEITRGGKTYPVTLQLKKIGNDWKIIRANAI